MCMRALARTRASSPAPTPTPTRAVRPEIPMYKHATTRSLSPMLGRWALMAQRVFTVDAARTVLCVWQAAYPYLSPSRLPHTPLRPGCASRERSTPWLM